MSASPGEPPAQGPIPAPHAQKAVPPSRVTVPAIQSRKASREGGGPRIVMITAYDVVSGRAADRAGADILLVGDSLGMVVLGRENTLSTTMDEMILHARAVA